jgi:hypothetical protein
LLENEEMGHSIWWYVFLQRHLTRLQYS